MIAWMGLEGIMLNGINQEEKIKYHIISPYTWTMGFPSGAVAKNLLTKAGDTRDLGSILGSGRSPGVENGSPLQHSCLENSMAEEPSRLTKSWTWLSTALGFLWKECCYSWNSSILATSCKELTLWKRLDVGRDWGQEEKGTTEDEMSGWHHGLDGHESQQTPGDGDEQGGLACCHSWGRKEADTT